MDEFSRGPFREIDNLRRVRSFGNSCNNPQENWQIFSISQVKSTQKFLHSLKAFPNFSFVCFHWKRTWHLSKVNKKVQIERVSNGNVTQSSCFGFMSFNAPLLVYSIKWPINYCYRIYLILCMILKKRLFIEALCWPLFRKNACCKPLFLFQNKA